MKFADTQKEKDAKRLQGVNSALWGAPVAAPMAVNPQYLAVSQLQVGIAVLALGEGEGRTFRS